MKDETELQALFDHHARALVLFGKRWAVSQGDAEDLVQDAFVRLWKNRERVNDPAAYLYAAVRTLGLDHWKMRQRRTQREEFVASLRPEALFENRPEQNELRQNIEQAIATLPDEQAEVLILKIWADLTFAQIAEALDVSRNTAASRYRYAAETLRGLLAREVRS